MAVTSFSVSPSVAMPIKRKRKSPVFNLVAPATLLVVFGLLAPLLLMFRYSFNKFVPAELMVSTFTLENYSKFFGDRFYQDVLLVTLGMSAASTAICLMLGFPVAYFLARIASDRWKSVFFIMIVLPLLMGNAVRTAAWMLVLGDKGLLSTMAGYVGLSLEKVMYTPTAVLVGLVSVLLPFMIIILLGTIQSIDSNLEHAAESLGARHLTVVRRVLLPLAMPGLLTGTMLCFILAMNAYATPVLLGGPQFHMMAPEIYQQVTKAMNWPFGAALAFALMAVTLVLVVVMTAVTQRHYRKWSE